MTKDVPSWEGKYQADSCGKIYSVRTGKEMYTIKDKCGYLLVQFFDSANKQRKTYAVHRIIAKTFLGNKTCETDTINHIDGDKENNDVSNLEYVDRSEQMYHAYRLGLKKPVHNSNQKLTEEQVLEIRKRYALGTRGNGAHSIAKSYRVSESCILNIVNGRTYNWVNERATTSESVGSSDSKQGASE
jgi:hypothetical protein